MCTHRNPGAAWGDTELSPTCKWSWRKKSMSRLRAFGRGLKTQVPRLELEPGNWDSWDLSDNDPPLLREKLAPKIRGGKAHLQGLDPRDRIFSSKALRDGRSLGDQYTPLLMLQPGRLKGLVQVPRELGVGQKSTWIS